MIPPKYTKQELSRLPVDFVQKEIRRHKRVIKRLKEELYWAEKDAWSFETKAAPALAAPTDRLAECRAFLKLAEEALAERGAYKPTQLEEVHDRRAANLQTAVWMEFALVTSAGVETVDIDLADDFSVKVMSRIHKAEKEGSVRKDVEDAFRADLADLHIEEWRLHYDCRDWNDTTDLPTWSLPVQLRQGQRGLLQGAGRAVLLKPRGLPPPFPVPGADGYCFNSTSIPYGV